jgi:hypothetical protein
VRSAEVPPLPTPRGPVSEAVLDALRREPGPLRHPSRRAQGDSDLLDDDDTQLALACCYELHYRSFAGVDDGWEWQPDLLALRGGIEARFVRRLEQEVGPSLSQFMEQRGTLENMREFCVHRSAYQLKEADPHTWMIPRLVGRAKAAAVTIQYDEYGEGSVAAMHSELFADTMRVLDLDATYGAYLDLLPATTLATGNLVTMFGLHRRWRAACVGHLALFEMTSVVPMGRYAAALRRLAPQRVARQFYDVHVVADAEHEQIAQHDLVAGFLESEPSAAGTVVFGARALVEVESRMASALLAAWSEGRSSLRHSLISGLVSS